MDFVHNKKGLRFFKYIEIVIDISLVNLGFYLAFLLRFNMSPASENIKPFIEIIPFISITAIIFFYIYGVFSMLKHSLIENIYSIILSLIMIDITAIAIAFLNRGFGFPRSVFILAWFIQIILLLVWKLTIWNIQKYLHIPKTILIVGPKEETDKIAKKIFTNRRYLGNIRYICNVVDNTIYKLIDEVDEVFLCASLDNEAKTKIVSYCIGTNKTVYLVPQLFEIALIKSQMEQFDDVPAFKIDNLYLSIEKRVVKRLFDILLSFIGIIIAFPIMLLVAIVIKLYDRGPILYSQERVTRGNKVFKLYKFRTMIVDAEKYTGPVLATEKDPRITPVGRILRTTRLDELPQLFNVLKGDMSIVGPRPERPHFVEQFIKEIPDFKYRVAVKAGITGLAQVLGKYTTTPEDKLRYDLLYIRNYSFLLDIKIILQTIKIMFMKESSSGVKQDKTLDEILKELNCKIYEEVGVTKIEF